MFHALVKTPNKKDLYRLSKWAKIREDKQQNLYFNFGAFKIYLNEVMRFGSAWLPIDDTLPDFIDGFYQFGLEGYYIELDQFNGQARVYSSH